MVERKKICTFGICFTPERCVCVCVLFEVSAVAMRWCERDEEEEEAEMKTRTSNSTCRRRRMALYARSYAVTHLAAFATTRTTRNSQTHRHIRAAVCVSE